MTKKYTLLNCSNSLATCQDSTNSWKCKALSVFVLRGDELNEDKSLWLPMGIKITWRKKKVLNCTNSLVTCQVLETHENDRFFLREDELIETRTAEILWVVWLYNGEKCTVLNWTNSLVICHDFTNS